MAFPSLRLDSLSDNELIKILALFYLQPDVSPDGKVTKRFDEGNSSARAAALLRGLDPSKGRPKEQGRAAVASEIEREFHETEAKRKRLQETSGQTGFNLGQTMLTGLTGQPPPTATGDILRELEVKAPLDIMLQALGNKQYGKWYDEYSMETQKAQRAQKMLEEAAARGTDVSLFGDITGAAPEPSQPSTPSGLPKWKITDLASSLATMDAVSAMYQDVIDRGNAKEMDLKLPYLTDVLQNARQMYQMFRQQESGGEGMQLEEMRQGRMDARQAMELAYRRESERRSYMAALDALMQQQATLQAETARYAVPPGMDVLPGTEAGGDISSIGKDVGMSMQPWRITKTPVTLPQGGPNLSRAIAELGG